MSHHMALLLLLFFPECVARVPVSFGGLGVRLCSPKVAFATATVRNRPQPSATVRSTAVRLAFLAFAEEVSVRVICVAAVILAFAEEVSVRVICVAAVILAFTEEVSVGVICVSAVISAFAEEVSV